MDITRKEQLDNALGAISLEFESTLVSVPSSPFPSFHNKLGLVCQVLVNPSPLLTLCTAPGNSS